MGCQSPARLWRTGEPITDSLHVLSVICPAWLGILLNLLAVWLMRGMTMLLRDSSVQMYYNTMVPIVTGVHAGRQMKYGVITVADLTQDLREWTWLYAAGRMHKPVRILQHCSSSNPELKQATRDNLTSAIRASLLQLPESFSAQDLYLKIAGLSYGGENSFHVPATHAFSDLKPRREGASVMW